jgi:hypothetical protein
MYGQLPKICAKLTSLTLISNNNVNIGHNKYGLIIR